MSKKAKRSKSPRHEVPGEGVKRSAAATSLKSGQDSEKILSKKRGKIPDEVRRVLDSPTPEIAHPEDPAMYIEQWRFVLSWFREMFKRTGSGDKKSALGARNALRTLWLYGLGELTMLALDNKRKAEKWAGRLLAITEYWTESDHEMLCKANEAYRQEQSELRKIKFQRSDVWFPTSKAAPLYKAIHREHWHIMFYRGELVLPKAQLHVQGLPSARRPVPEQYQPFMKLRPLSPKTLPEWEPKIWALVTKKYPDVFEHLRASARRNRKQGGDGKIKWKGIESYIPTIKEFRSQFRNHLRAIARRSG